MSIPSIAQLKQAVTIAEQIEKLQAELAGLVGGSSVQGWGTGNGQPASSSTKQGGGKRTMSPATIAKMRASQQARWAKKAGGEVVTAVETVVENAVKSTAKLAKKAKRKLSPEGRAKIVAALKKRWAAKKKATK